MLEEALTKPTFNPAEAAVAFLGFIRYELPTGGALAEERFFRLFGLLIERLFGPLESLKDVKKGEVWRHEIGGWLSYKNQWKIPSSSSTPTRMSRNNSVRGGPTRPGRQVPSPRHYSQRYAGQQGIRSLDSDPVVQLLCGMESLNDRDKLPTLIEAVSSEAEHRPGIRFHFPFQALPKATQEFILNLIQPLPNAQHVDQTSNGALLIGLLSIPLKDQHEIRRHHGTYFGKNGNPSHQGPLNPFGVGFNSPLMKNAATRKAGAPAPNATTPTKDKKVEPDVPHLLMSMLEMYLFQFLRYPTAAPKQASPAPQGARLPGRATHSSPSTPSAYSPGAYRHRAQASDSSSKNAYGDQVYSHLFKCYLKHFAPHGSIVVAQKDFLGLPNLNKDGQLFLRLLSELWMGPNTTTPISVAVHRWRDHCLKNGQETTLNLNEIFNLVKASTTYEKPLPQVQNGVRSLVIHLMKDHHIRLAVRNCEEAQRHQSLMPSLRSDLPWCIPAAMTLMMRTMFNYFCSSLCNAPIHETNSAFVATLEAWLMWIEPWNMELRKRFYDTMRSGNAAGSMLASTMASVTAVGSSTSQGANSGSGTNQFETFAVLKILKGTTRSRYSAEWEPYIAANLHFYTVPLALFLKRARELDFSSRRSHGLIQTVFRVYTPQVVMTIKCLLSDPQNHPYSTLLFKHNDVLGQSSPAHIGPGLTLTSLREDMQNLLEEVYMQYLKKVSERDIFDRMEARIEGFFTWINLMTPSGGEERDIRLLIEQARVMDLPSDYEITPPDGNRLNTARTMFGGSDAPLLVPERDEMGLLTDRGREQIMSGEVICSPMDIVYHGDKMRSRERPHELTFLVPWLVRMSDFLNHSFRIVKLQTDKAGRAVDASMEEYMLEPEGSVLRELLEEEVQSRKASYRFNLRFLADYRNIVFVVLITWYWRRLYNFVAYMLTNGTEDGKILFLGISCLVFYIIGMVLYRAPWNRY